MIEQRDKLREKYLNEPGIMRPAVCSTDRDKEFADRLNLVLEKHLSRPELTIDEFVELEKTTFFKKNAGHEKVAKLDKQGNPVKDKNGNPVYKAGKPNGWLVEQGGYPPLAFGFSGGMFYIKIYIDADFVFL